MKDKEFIEKVLFLDTVHTSPENREYELYKICEQYRKDKEERNNKKPAYINACGSCKYFKDAIPHNKLWYTCQHSPYKTNGKGHKEGELRSCCAGMRRCCYYEKEG